MFDTAWHAGDEAFLHTDVDVLIIHQKALHAAVEQTEEHFACCVQQGDWSKLFRLVDFLALSDKNNVRELPTSRYVTARPHQLDNACKHLGHFGQRLKVTYGRPSRPGDDRLGFFLMFCTICSTDGGVPSNGFDGGGGRVSPGGAENGVPRVASE